MPSIKDLFVSELDASNPEHREEMNKRVFGRNYRRDAKGNPINDSNTGDFSIRNGIAQHDRIEAHLKAVLKSEGPEAYDHELSRIRAIQVANGQPPARDIR